MKPRVLGLVLAGLILLLMGLALLTVNSGNPDAAPSEPAAKTSLASGPSLAEPAAKRSQRGPSPLETLADSPVIEETANSPAIVWSGRILDDETGAPIAESRVRVVTVGTRIEPGLESFRPLAETATDADGRFQLSASPTLTPAMATSIWIAANGYTSRAIVPREAGSIWPLPGGGRDVEIRLRRANGVLAGRVVDEAGKGIGGALLIAREHPPMAAYESPGRLLPVEITLADAAPDGQFLIEDVAQGFPYSVTATAPGYGQASLAMQITDARGLVLKLPRASSSLTVTVESEGGDPVPDAFVLVQKKLNYEPLATYFPAQTDAGGIARFPELPADSYEVKASWKRSEAEDGTLVEVDLAEDEHRDVTLVLKQSVLLHGRAVDEETGEPVAGLALSALPMDGDPSRAQAISGPGGDFAFPVEPFYQPSQDVSGSPDPFGGPSRSGSSVEIFMAAPEGYAFSRSSGTGNDMRRRFDASALKDPQVIEVPRGNVVRGRVLRSDRSPVEGAEVSGRYETDSPFTKNPLIESSRTASGLDGRFVLTLPAGKAFRLLASKPGIGSVTSEEYPAEPLAGDVTLILEDFAAVAGTVRDFEGSGVPHVSIRVSRPGTRDLTGKNELLGQGRTGPDGYYVVEDIPHGEVEITAESRDPGLAPADPAELTLAPGQLAEGVDFLLDRADVIDVVVLDAETDEPFQGARVSWIVEGSEPRIFQSGSTDAEGRFTIRQIPPDGHVSNLTASLTGYESQSVSAASVYDSPVKIFLTRLGKATLSARGPGGAPVRHFRYQVFQYPGHAIETLMHTGDSDPASGTADVTGLLGKYLLRFEVLELDPETGALTGRMGAKSVQRGSPSEVIAIEVPIGGGHELRGTVVRVNGAGKIPIADAFVKMLPPNNFRGNDRTRLSLSEPVRTDERGLFRFPSVIAAPHRLLAYAPGGEQSRTITVPMNEDGTYEEPEIVFGSLVELSGQVTGRDGTPLAGATVKATNFLTDGSNRDLTTETGEDGRYAFNDLAPGRLTVTLAGDPPRTVEQRERLDVEAGDHPVVNFDLSAVVEIQGRLLVNGTPPTGWEFQLDPAGEGATNPLPLDLQPDGSFTALANPGRYTAWRSGGDYGLVSNFPQGVVRIPPTPAAQVIDIDLSTVPVDVVVMLPEGTAWEDLLRQGDLGMRLLQRFSTGEVGTVLNSIAPSQSKRLVDVPSGEYQIELIKTGRPEMTASGGYRVVGEEELGASPITAVGPGLENVLVVELMKSAP
ncbi:MAG: carboxypeptidase regulatory-like domain-containing protein [Sumerlaeia bacterium]